MSVYVKKDNKGKKRNDTPTPYKLCDFLYRIISKKYDPVTILDCCCGDSRLTASWRKNNNCNVIEYEIKKGKDFLQETEKIKCDMVIMNTPFNIGTGRKLAVEVFIDKVLELVDNDIPIIMICPMGFRLNQRYKSKRWKKIRNKYPPITTIISLPLDCFEETLFHSEVVCFNTALLDPHYFIDYDNR